MSKRLILTNDDGIEAPGLAALERAVDGVGEVVVVAPRGPMSQVGHRLTTHQPIHVERRGENKYAVDGAPADCARIAIRHVLPEADFLISGINAGGNLGADVYPSGTVAAAREAAFLGKPAIAVSQYKRKRIEFDWASAARLAAKVLNDLMARPQEAGSFWNVNLPHLKPGQPDPEVVECPVCTSPLPVEFEIDGEQYRYAGVYEQRLASPGSDVAYCLAGKITVSRIRL